MITAALTLLGIFLVIALLICIILVGAKMLK